jgi:hypothetical protein
MASSVLPGGRRKWSAETEDDARAELDALRAVGGPFPCEEDPELWFVDETCTGDVARAKAGCMACPGRSACLELSLIRADRNGIWGGLTATERGFGRGHCPELVDPVPDHTVPLLAVVDA